MLGTPPPVSSSESAGYYSRHSAHFGNVRSVTYDDIVYAPHQTYRFDPNLDREHFNTDAGVTGGGVDVRTGDGLTDGLN
ncbi:MAG: hypothetical protein U0457_05355 [Candidatus Sericytochromatia bacterium]